MPCPHFAAMGRKANRWPPRGPMVRQTPLEKLGTNLVQKPLKPWISADKHGSNCCEREMARTNEKPRNPRVFQQNRRWDLNPHRLAGEKRQTEPGTLSRGHLQAPQRPGAGAEPVRVDSQALEHAHI